MFVPAANGNGLKMFMKTNSKLEVGHTLANCSLLDHKTEDVKITAR